MKAFVRRPIRLPSAESIDRPRDPFVSSVPIGLSGEQVIHREFYGGAVSLTRLATLDAATGLAALVAGAALMWPSSARRGHVAHRWRISAFCAAVAAGTWAAVGWFQSIVRVEEAERMTGARRHMLWLPAVASGIPLLCAYCYRLLEGTVVEARALRGYMYEHKRA